MYGAQRLRNHPSYACGPCLRQYLGTAGGRRDRIVLATKVHSPMGQDANERGNSRRWVIRECENSLRRLGTDYIDLYQIHRPDPATGIDETLGALSDLIRAGKICYAGAADVVLPAEILDKIDEIVPPGTTLNRPDRGYEPPALTDPAMRRRPSSAIAGD